MKKLFVIIIILYSAAINTGCTGNSTYTDTDSAAVITDTMPVLKPGSADSIGIMATPPTNDANAIMPDSAIKSK